VINQFVSVLQFIMSPYSKFNNYELKRVLF